MKHPQREAAKQRLEHLLSGNPITQGMYVRTWGDHLIVGRHEAFGPHGEMDLTCTITHGHPGVSLVKF